MAGGRKPLVVVAAGGTGGHLFPAEALSVALQRRGIAVDLATDERATRYGTTFPARATHVIASATVRGRNPISLITTATVLAYGLARAFSLFGRLKPAAVIGFGGYPTIPPVLAASLRGIPTLIHEQNGVLGRANRLLSGRVRALATGFPGVIDRKPLLAVKATHTGNPVRAAVIEASRIPYPPVEPTGPFHLLAFGGSQGARIMADIVPPAIGHLPADLRQRLSVVQQAREEDLAHVRDTYARLNVTAEVAPFFSDLPARIANAHLIVSRAGASTVAELAAIGRPAILVPLPHALDQDQLANASVLERAGGAVCVNQKSFSAKWLSGEIARLAATPQKLVAMAAAARSVGAVDAADRLAELVISVAQLDNKVGQVS
ncbi:MAG: undecaprenyldiphospho-muramoylpentapeptide beta-N-acetylglucosaminyltransferase [Bradyrhizobiaceae bacterium]|nr:undecaprenyldiphospho-muramoylpentapeptide beta-N-acetylglucosaminyltransferase [Bradyrhizobiaceae bacterium]